ncbi:MAG TPA: ABC transporter permease [Paludibaculum sp.]|jgi:predicted permease
MPRIPMWRRYARMFGADPAADVNDELHFHLEAKVDDLVEQGWAREEAWREAERQFGDFKSVRAAGERLGREMDRNMRNRDFWSACAQDFRYSLRTLRKDRGFAIVTVLILALGIAANTAVFSVVNTVLLRPLPFPDSDRLAWLASGRDLVKKGTGGGGDDLSNITYTVAAFEEFQRHNQSFQQVTSYNPFLANGEFLLTGRGEPQIVDALMVAENFFPTLGVEPVLGRNFLPQECRIGGTPAVLLSHAFWQRRFAGGSGIVGQGITMDRQSFTVVGVLPPTFDFGAVFSPGTKIDVYVPVVLDNMRNWGNTLAMVGRLKPGSSIAQAQAEADVLFPQFKAAHKDWWGDYVSRITGLKEFVSGKLRRSLIVLWSAVGLILLIVCVNLSNLMLARAATRSREFALRSALGAGRGRLVRQLLTESLILSSAGAVLGLGLAYALTTYLARQGSIALPLLNNVRVDGVALLWTLLITVAVTVIFGLAPGLNISSRNLVGALKDSGRGTTSGRRHERLRATLVISEVALSCVLLIGAGLLLRSFLKVLDVDLGFQPGRAAVITVSYEDGRDRERRGAILQEMLLSIQSIPGVEAAGVGDMLPLGRNRSWGFRAKGIVYDKEETLGALVRIVTPGYLGAMGTHLTGGRDFSWQDGPKSETAVVINRAAAVKFWRGEDPVGRLGQIAGRDARVIGVIDDVRAHSLEAPAGPEMYLMVTQANPNGAELVIRTKLPPATLAPTVMQRLRSLNPAQPATELRPLQQIVDRSVSPRRFFVWLVCSFAALGLILASLGIYGVISYSVACRTQEIGIRMALGATAPQVQIGVIGKAVKLAFVGVVAGGLGSLVAARWIESLLFGTRPTDPATFAVIILLLAAVALIAGFIPARRASCIDPAITLRAD